MPKKVLVLGHTGKIGRALVEVLNDEYEVMGKNSQDFDAEDLDSVRRIVMDSAVDVVVNTVAYMGIDRCEKEPEKAFRINTLLPRYLAEMTGELDYWFVHFSTDAVFDDEKGDYLVESDSAQPVNVYGSTKYGGDCAVMAGTDQYYIFRVPIQFGETIKAGQFVEKMLQRVEQGQKEFRIAGDVISSPTYSRDVAEKVKEILEQQLKPGLYHVANEGKASLYELMEALTEEMQLHIELQRGSYRDFPFVGRKNLYTPLASEKIALMRPWRAALRDYCRQIKNTYERSRIV